MVNWAKQWCHVALLRVIGHLGAEEQKEADRRKKERESKEEERVMAAMVQNELQRQRKSAKESKGTRTNDGFMPLRPSKNSVADSEELEFDQLCTTKDKAGNTISQLYPRAKHHLKGDSLPRLRLAALLPRITLTRTSKTLRHSNTIMSTRRPINVMPQTHHSGSSGIP